MTADDDSKVKYRYIKTNTKKKSVTIHAPFCLIIMSRVGLCNNFATITDIRAKFEFSIDFECTGKDMQFKIHFKSELKVIHFVFIKETSTQKQQKRRNFEQKQHLVQNDQNAGTALLHSRDDYFELSIIIRTIMFSSAYLFTLN